VAESTRTTQRLPRLHKDTTFHDWTFVNKGTHAENYRAKESMYPVECCLKLFQAGWITSFNLEKAVYEVLLAADIHEVILTVHAYDCRTLSA